MLVNAVPGGSLAATAWTPTSRWPAAPRGIAPLELTKWFDTNYHYLVPELGPGTDLRLAGDKPVREYLEARSYGIETRPVLLGPLSFLLLSQSPPSRDSRRWTCSTRCSTPTSSCSRSCTRPGPQWVQLDEPALAADRSGEELDGAAPRLPPARVAACGGRRCW